MKKFIKKFLGIEELSIIVRETNLSHRNAIKELKNLNCELEKRIKYLEQENRELICFISSVFPEYYHLNQAHNKLIEFKRSLKDEHWTDPLIYQVIMRKDEEFSKRKEQAIANNELNIKSICLKVSEEVFNKLIDEKFPIPEEFKEEQNKDSEYIGGKL